MNETVSMSLLAYPCEGRRIRYWFLWPHSCILLLVGPQDVQSGYQSHSCKLLLVPYQGCTTQPWCYQSVVWDFRIAAVHIVNSAYYVSACITDTLQIYPATFTKDIHLTSFFPTSIDLPHGFFGFPSIHLKCLYQAHDNLEFMAVTVPVDT